ncbi:hypothetical protein FJZ17_00290 [Candidatus Pacearchaeota archaeon]|nr:hypothetical protein [Candidatus Pacearchaeota archaeon]
METNENIIRHFAKKGFLLDKDISELFNKIADNDFGESLLTHLFALTKQRIISKRLFESNLNEVKSFFAKFSPEKKQILDSFFLSNPFIEKKEEKRLEIQEKKVFPTVKILSSNIIPYKKIEVRDFVTHFKNRYNFFKDVLKERKELTNLLSINKIGNSRSFSIIGLVFNKRVTKNKNIILEVEDITGKVNLLISCDKKEVFDKAKEIVLDDVIGFKCSGNGDLIYVNDLFFADSFIVDKKRAEEEVYALFISDIHIGSTLFLEKSFLKFLDWINGRIDDEKMKEKISKIKYLFILGDNVDGVGVHPAQEPLLKIKDIKDQYKALAELLERIPKNITMIMCPGQHDAVRVPEPQPPVDEEFGLELTKINNLFLVSNPALIEIESSERKPGFKVGMYHGASMHDWIDSIEDLRQGQANKNPSKVVKYMLRHRHLSPMHAGNVYVPSDKEDMQMIKEVPDIMATGDMHRTDIDMYNNILIVCGSCWQSQTAFEEKVGNIPDPCKVPMLNLKTREIKILDFTEPQN